MTLAPARRMTLTLASQSRSVTLSAGSEALALQLAAFMRGPRGLQGDQGEPGLSGVQATYTADGALSGHRVVRASGAGAVAYADSANVAHATTVLGITTGAAADGDPVTIQAGGPISEPSWAWTPDQPVYCGGNGQLTQVAPVAGFVLVVGVAVSATEIFVGIKQAIVIN